MVSRIANGKLSITPTLMMNKNHNRFKLLNINSAFRFYKIYGKKIMNMELQEIIKLVQKIEMAGKIECPSCKRSEAERKGIN